MIALYSTLAAFVLIAVAQTVRHYANRVIDEVLAAEQRQIERVQAAGLEANRSARWQG